MRFLLEAGNEVDLLTAEELQQKLSPLVRAVEALNEDSFIMKVETHFVTSAAGAINEQQIWECPLGYSAFVNRLVVTADGATPLAPIAAGRIEFYRGAANPASLFMFLPPGGVNVAPAIITSGGEEAEMLKAGTPIVILGTGLPVNTKFYFNLQIRLIKAVN